MEGRKRCWACLNAERDRKREELTSSSCLPCGPWRPAFGSCLVWVGGERGRGLGLMRTSDDYLEWPPRECTMLKYPSIHALLSSLPRPTAHINGTQSIHIHSAPHGHAHPSIPSFPSFRPLQSHPSRGHLPTAMASALLRTVPWKSDACVVCV